MELFIIIILLLVAVETSYLAYETTRKNQRFTQAPVFVDTSVLIDGRIVAIAESGFITRPLAIPRSVVGELQFLADNADTDKRTRARHGLDVISQLQALTTVRAEIFTDSVRAEEGVDNRLLKLAKKHKGALCTIDYNLNKVAVVEGIEVLNVNELAKSLRMAYLPGERTFIELTQKGNDQHQGVGHLEDGTMVVVEHAYKQVGSKVEVEFIRSLQTAAGKMMFARLVVPSAPLQKPEKQAQKVVKGTKRAAEKTQVPRQATPQPSQKPQPQGQKQPRASQSRPQQPRGQRQARRRSPEDSLVELANKQ
ncbi:MAG TPA: hypothetical protein VN081_01600 [Dongiaceae bacterium]|nr:hypothetical protein [Dongiaceae bacterium]